jgi:hypothetical protein
MYLRLEDNAYPFSEQDIKNANPNTSFSAVFQPEGYVWVFPVPQPEYDRYTQMCTQGLPELTSKGTWQEVWNIVDLADEALANGLARKVSDEAEAKVRLQQAIVDAAQKRLDDFAKTRNYDGILSACTYASSSIPSFATEGQYCVDMRDATWSSLYTYLAEVEATTKPVPTTVDEVISVLPAFTWP